MSARMANGYVVSDALFDWLRPIGAVAARKARAWERRKARRTAQCRSCAKFISRPSAICGQCGNDPVGNTTNGQPDAHDRWQYDRAYGWEAY